MPVRMNLSTDAILTLLPGSCFVGNRSNMTMIANPTNPPHPLTGLRRKILGTNIIFLIIPFFGKLWIMGRKVVISSGLSGTQ